MEDRGGDAGSFEGRPFPCGWGNSTEPWISGSKSVEEIANKLLELNVVHALKWSHENVKNLKQNYGKLGVGGHKRRASLERCFCTSGFGATPDWMFISCLLADILKKFLIWKFKIQIQEKKIDKQGKLSRTSDNNSMCPAAICPGFSGSSDRLSSSSCRTTSHVLSTCGETLATS